MLIDFRTLFPKYNIHPKGILHCGANVGEEAPVYLELGVKKQVWIEANLKIYPLLISALQGNAEAVALNYCISDKEEEVTFHISNNGSQSSSILELGTHLQAHPEVHYIEEIKMNAISISKLVKSDSLGLFDNLDFLNIDLQGAELKALHGMGDYLHQFKWAYLEVNKEELYLGCPMVEDLDFYLGAFGFKRVETKWCGSTGWGDALYIKG